MEGKGSWGSKYMVFLKGIKDDTFFNKIAVFKGYGKDKK